ncbi:MAG: glutamate-5-semialdehyde dehydrogenase [Candidatus Obscuribacterales bacterium]|nr:glutamate-5-semialdehyde dehydrogenase [Candidatus Obscuribacterales bacterium]
MVKPVESNPTSIKDIIAAAKKASFKLGAMSDSDRVQALQAMASALKAGKDTILAANQKDLDAAKIALANGEIDQAAYKRLVLNEEKLQTVIDGINQVSQLESPVGKVLLKRELDDGLILSQITCSIGLIAIIFESRPDALPQIIALCLKSGNAAILKGGKEAQATNSAIFSAIQNSLSKSGISNDAYALSHSREVVATMLSADGQIDLIIPRGSNELVRHIMDNTRIPVLGHAAGICHVYVDEMADLDKALAICVDAKANYPAACNAAETILVHKKIAAQFLPWLLKGMDVENVRCRCDQSVEAFVSLADYENASAATAGDFGCEFSELIVAVKVVKTIDEAIAHINQFGSNHTESIVTESETAATKFFNEINSAGVFQNASTRFADGFRYGFGAEVGISNGKLHPRGPVGLEGLVSYKYKLVGDGHIVASYSEKNGRKFKHIDLEK